MDYGHNCDNHDTCKCSMARAVQYVELWRMLTEVYKPEGVEAWLNAKQVRFGGRSALDCLADGDLTLPLQAAEQLVTGAMG